MNLYSDSVAEATQLPELTEKARVKFRSFFVGSVNGNAIYSRYFENIETEFQAHKSTDEMFMVQSGTLYIDLKKARTIVLAGGNSYVVPAGMSYRLRAKELTRALVVRKGLG